MGDDRDAIPRAQLDAALEQFDLLRADTPVTCARCRRTVTLAADEVAEWIWIEESAEGILYACASCATGAERAAFARRPIERVRVLAREANALSSDDSAWTPERRPASEARLREVGEALLAALDECNREEA